MPRIVAQLFFAIASVSVIRAESAPPAPTWHHEIIARHPHDTRAFTQGLTLVDGRFLESTGGHGRSTLTLRERAGGRILREHRLAPRYFGEGVARLGARIVQLTWRSGLALVYDARLQPAGAFTYEGEGWGLTTDGRDWFMSDGSDRIVRRDAETFAVRGAVSVRDGATPVSLLNELEFADGLIFANVWRSDRIVVIEPATGQVRGWLDLSALRADFAKPRGWDQGEHVLNGVAHDPATGHFFVTGKCWPVLYELTFQPPPGSR